MLRSQREKAIVRLHDIWQRRDVPHISDVELAKMDDETVAYLHRFWTHKDRWWDVTGAPDFTEAPPHPPEALPALLVPRPSLREEKITGSRNFGRTFKGTNGGRQTGRQALKSHRN